MLLLQRYAMRESDIRKIKIKHEATAHANEQSSNNKKQTGATPIQFDLLRQEVDRLKEQFETTQTITTRAITTLLAQPNAMQKPYVNQLVKAAVENAVKLVTTPNKRPAFCRPNANPANPALVTCYNCETFRS